ncbi:OmpA family protein [Thiocystis violacea]|uniref:OmpA family protein n=1 Tax=Thiocystis violacea TaxID=13725 RepID=UPI0019086DC8|nr:OmpA family protein [Thiocystis violacea]MBK1720101.1 hypothetical protein [Thiocystis violacea]
MIARRSSLLLLVLFLGGVGQAWAADCERGRALHRASWAEPDLHQRIARLRQASAVCPDPEILTDLATACLGAGDPKAAIDALIAASRLVGPAARQSEIQAELARLYLEQNQLPEAIVSIDRAIDAAGLPIPTALLELRRRIDRHPDRARLSAAQITRGLAARGTGVARGFVPQSRLDLYVLFDFNQDQPNAEGLAQVEELARALQAGASGQDYRLIGHTDAQGAADYNRRLSERRADRVRRLVEDRVPALSGRLHTAGRGESELKYPGDTEEDHRLNRRVELEAVSLP